MKNSQIEELISTTNNFVAETLCPMVEGFTGAKSREALNSALYATLRTVARNIDVGNLKIAKSGGKFVILDNDEQADGEKEDPGPDDDFSNEMCGEIEKIVKIAKSHSKNREDFYSSLASAALTIVQTGGSGAMLSLVVGLSGLIDGEI